MREPEEVVTMSGQTLPRKMQISMLCFDFCSKTDSKLYYFYTIDIITVCVFCLLPVMFFLFLGYISFSAHADYEQLSEFVNILKPPHIVSGHFVEYFTNLM